MDINFFKDFQTHGFILIFLFLIHENLFAPDGHFQMKRRAQGSSLAVQWLGLHASIAGGMGSIPGWGTKIPQALRHSQKNRNTEPMP